MEWQPIETAPKDGTSLLLWVRQKIERYPGCVIVGHWTGYSISPWAVSEVSGHEFDGPLDDGYPTHWMPLPPPPQK